MSFSATRAFYDSPDSPGPQASGGATPQPPINVDVTTVIAVIVVTRTRSIRPPGSRPRYEWDALSGPKPVLAVTSRYACITKRSGSMILVIQSASDGSLHPDPGATER